MRILFLGHAPMALKRAATNCCQTSGKSNLTKLEMLSNKSISWERWRWSEVRKSVRPCVEPKKTATLEAAKFGGRDVTAGVYQSLAALLPDAVLPPQVVKTSTGLYKQPLTKISFVRNLGRNPNAVIVVGRLICIECNIMYLPWFAFYW